jgi:hypothetical protein
MFHLLTFILKPLSGSNLHSSGVAIGAEKSLPAPADT